ncbi:hypothetical protein HDV03_001631 [Kappamyces sp. JEL0829]|nr:hypothetical protein HDV03_001631 [Kappamyces sp. JEL0829]
MLFSDLATAAYVSWSLLVFSCLSTTYGAYRAFGISVTHAKFQLLLQLIALVDLFNNFFELAVRIAAPGQSVLHWAEIVGSLYLENFGRTAMVALLFIMYFVARYELSVDTFSIPKTLLACATLALFRAAEWVYMLSVHTRRDHQGSLIQVEDELFAADPVLRWSNLLIAIVHTALFVATCTATVLEHCRLHDGIAAQERLVREMNDNVRGDAVGVYTVANGQYRNPELHNVDVYVSMVMKRLLGLLAFIMIPEVLTDWVEVLFVSNFELSINVCYVAGKLEWIGHSVKIWLTIWILETCRPDRNTIADDHQSVLFQTKTVKRPEEAQMKHRAPIIHFPSLGSHYEMTTFHSRANRYSQYDACSFRSPSDLCETACELPGTAVSQQLEQFFLASGTSYCDELRPTPTHFAAK